MTWLARAGLVVAGVVVGALVLELGLRALGGLVDLEPDAAPERDGYFVVLCVGDSRTWGDGTGYPAWVGEILSARSDRYWVVNLGMPGTNTAQLRRRLGAWIDAYRPSVVVVWSGINNFWNRTDTEGWVDAGAPERTFADALLDASKLLRLVRVWRDQRALHRLLSEEPSHVAPPNARREGDPERLWRRELVGGTDEPTNVGGRGLGPDALARATRADVEAIAAIAADEGVPVLSVDYPLIFQHYGVVNAAISAGAAAAGAPLVEGVAALRDLRRRDNERGELRDYFDASVHPVQELYARIGERVVERLDAEGWLDDRAASP